MSDVIMQHLGDDWKIIFNVDDYYHLVEDYLDIEEEVEEY